jgi:general L-amino acid transport system substrate-binding protein
MRLPEHLIALLAVVSLALAGSAQATTLDDVKRKGFVQCGVSQGVPGFSNLDADGTWTGIDVDVCRAVAAAVFGDADAVRYSPLSAKQRFSALQSGEIDILSRNTTWTLERDTALGLNFAGVNYYDGQGFMVRKELGVSSAYELAGTTVCVNIGTTTELSMADFFRTNRMDYRPVAFETADEVVAAYDAGRCDVYTTDLSGLAAQRLKLSDPDAHVVLPEVITKSPLGPAVRHGDDQWYDIVKWSLFAMIEAEESGVTSENAERLKAESDDPAVRRLLGVEGDIGRYLGLGNDWAYNIVRQVGNYGESFERHVGVNTPVGLPRGMNQLWSKGGLMYSMPVR